MKHSNNARLTYFDVPECGFYGTSPQKNKYGSIEFIFASICTWLKDREEVQHTTPWPEGRAEQYPKKSICYCNSFYSDQRTGDYVFVLWRTAGDTADGKSLWGISRKSKIGNLSFKEKNIGSDEIWGRPSYYWVIPSKKLIASVKLDTSICDKEMFLDWVMGCVQYKIDLPNKTREQAEDHFKIYFKDQDGQRYRFKIDMHMKMLGTLETKMDKIAPEVKSIMLRQTVAVKQSNDLSLFPWLAKKFKDSYGEKNTRRVELTYDTKLSAKQMKDIIMQYNSDAENDSHESWERLGFKTKQGKTVFADEYRATGKIVLGSASSRILDANELWGALASKREELLTDLESCEQDECLPEKNEEELAMEEKE